MPHGKMDLAGGIYTELAGCRKLSGVPSSQHMASETFRPGCSLQQILDLHHHLEPDRWQASFQVTRYQQYFHSHIDLGPVKGFKGGPDVGLTSGHVPSVWATVGGWKNDTAPSPLILSQHETGWDTAETSNSFLMRTAWDNSREQDSWGWKGSFKYASESVGKGRSWDRSCHCLLVWIITVMGILIPSFIRSKEQPGIERDYWWGVWRTLLDVLMSRLGGIRKGVSQQSPGLQTIWSKGHFVPTLKI